MDAETDCPRRLILLRHAKPEAGGPDVDELRQLAAAGRDQAVRISVALLARGLVPGQVLCSSATRARQTWDLVRAGLTDVKCETLFTNVLYAAVTSDVMALMRDVDDRIGTVLVVGHEPTLSRTATRLADESSDGTVLAHARNGLSTGTFLVLEFNGKWAELDRRTAKLRTAVTTSERTLA